MGVSKNPTEYLRRKGLLDAPARPRPRLDVDALLVHTMPLKSPPHPTEGVLTQYEGVPSPDRNITRAWPGQTE